MASRPSPLQPAVSTMDRVEAWTAQTVSQAADVLAATSISSPPRGRTVRGTTVKIDIPLDESVSQEKEQPRIKLEPVHTVYKRSEPIRRDSLKRREALLKGKEGSRQRRRWENDRLLNNPWAEAPLPSDWEVRPTHPVHSVPYFLAPLWDAEYARASQERKKRSHAAKQPANKEEAAAAKVKQELRATLKRSRGAKGLLMDLEEEVRGFIEKWEEKQRQLEKEGLIEPDSEDEEIVFVGRNGVMSDEKRKNKEEDVLRKDKVIFQSLVDDHGAAFGRYLVHCLARYYSLNTWSVTTGQPARREAYIGLKTDPKTMRPSLMMTELPRPLYAVVFDPHNIFFRFLVLNYEQHLRHRKNKMHAANNEVEHPTPEASRGPYEIPAELQRATREVSNLSTGMLRLPTEIRNEIMVLAIAPSWLELCPESTLEISTRDQSAMRMYKIYARNLAQVCRTLRTDATAIYWGSRRIAFDVRAPRELDLCFKFVEDVSDLAISSLRIFELTLRRTASPETGSPLLTIVVDRVQEEVRIHYGSVTPRNRSLDDNLQDYAAHIKWTLLPAIEAKEPHKKSKILTKDDLRVLLIMARSVQAPKNGNHVW